MGDDVGGWAAQEYPTRPPRKLWKVGFEGGVSLSLGGRDRFLTTNKKDWGGVRLEHKKTPIMVVLFVY
jgi:hypothetical protein